MTEPHLPIASARSGTRSKAVDTPPAAAAKYVGNLALRSILLGRPLGESLGGRDNNLNLLRMLAALAVLVSHGYVLSSGNPATEPLWQSTGASLGTYAVALFFGISGLLISRSFERRASIWHFAASRVMRLWPGLLAALAISCFVLGPWVTELGWKEYFSARGTLAYVPLNLTLAVRIDELPGVFLHNPIPLSINGSTWSLLYEVLCYCGVVAVGALGALRKGWRFGIFLALVLVAYGVSLVVTPENGIAYRIHTLVTVGFPFALGMACYVWRNYIPLNLLGVIFFIILCYSLSDSILFSSAIEIAVIYATLWLAYVPRGFLLQYNRLGDFSYGTYIFAHPVQQTLVQLDPDMGAAANVALALPVTLVLAIASWHLVENASLARAQRVGDRIAALAARVGAGAKR